MDGAIRAFDLLAKSRTSPKDTLRSPIAFFQSLTRFHFTSDERFVERRRMMQQWADYLDKLNYGAGVIPLHGHIA